MAQYRDLHPSESGWIHELAKAEMHPDAEKLLQLGGSFDPQQMVEEGAIQFLSHLRELFEEYARSFNGYSNNGEAFQPIKVYSIAQAPADFMIYRNQVKLICSNVAHGVIQISFSKHNRGTLAVDGQLASHSESGAVGQPLDIVAQVGPFRDVEWVCQNVKVTPEKVAKFYFTEFVRVTRDFSRSRANSQLLLEQIKTFLQEKGINL